VEQGNFDEAERVLRESAALPSAGAYAHAVLGYALARGGKRAEAATELAWLEARAAQGYVSAAALATIYLGLEDWPRFYEWTERAMAERRGWLVYLTVNPMFDAVRDQPAFQELVKRMKL
jgi:hypothetical protein